MLVPGREARRVHAVLPRARPRDGDLGRPRAGPEGRGRRLRRRRRLSHRRHRRHPAGPARGPRAGLLHAWAATPSSTRVMGWVNASARRARGGAAHAGGVRGPGAPAARHAPVQERGAKCAAMRRAAQITAARPPARHAGRAAPGMVRIRGRGRTAARVPRAGAPWPAYPPIVGGGANGCILHYTENNAPLQRRRPAADRRRLRATTATPPISPAPFPSTAASARRSARSTRWCWRRSRRPSSRCSPGNHWNEPHDAAVRVLTEGPGRPRPAQGQASRTDRRTRPTSASTCTAPATGWAWTCTTWATTRSAASGAAGAGHGADGGAGPVHPRRQPRAWRRSGGTSASASRTTCW